MLKTGSDHFEIARVPPKVDVCDRSYVFNADTGGRELSPTAACPPYQMPEGLRIAVAQKQAADEAQMTRIVAQLAQEAERAAEAQRIAEEKRVAADARAAEKQAAKEARTEQLQEKLGVFGRIFGRDDDEPTPKAVVEAPPAAAEASEAPVTAFAPAATTPVPHSKPAAAVAPSPASSDPAATPPAAAKKPVAQSGTDPAITPEMTPAIPEVGRFVKKEFMWIGDDGETDG
jgi:hypothetical protein